VSHNASTAETSRLKSKTRVPVGTAGELQSNGKASSPRQSTRTTTTDIGWANCFTGGETNNRPEEGQPIFDFGFWIFDSSEPCFGFRV